MHTHEDRIGKFWKEQEGKKIIVESPGGNPRLGTVRLRKVKCGKKNCKKCPHAIYAYAQYREGKKIKTKYLGVGR